MGPDPLDAEAAYHRDCNFNVIGMTTKDALSRVLVLHVMLCKDSYYGFCRVSNLRLLHALSDRHRLNLIEQRRDPYADPTVLFYSLLNTQSRSLQ